jgi:hypothetical protein
MSGRASFFPTGANCKIKLNGVTLAYATDLQYRVSIPHQTPTSLGNYEVSSIEPLSYKVSGSFTIVRYIEGAVSRAVANGLAPPNGTHNDGNGVGSWTPNRGDGIKNAIANTIGKPNDGRAHHSLDPSKLQDAVQFDIEIYQKVLPKEVEFVSTALLPFGQVKTFTEEYSGVARFRNVRIVDAVTALNKRSAMTQTFNFIAQYLDEDSFLADPSGQGQQNA